MKSRYYKKCTECLYYLATHIKEESMCLKYGKRQPNLFERADRVRNDPSKCGEDAKLFISKYIK